MWTQYAEGVVLRKAVGSALGEVLGVLDGFALGSVLGTRDPKSKEQDFKCEKSYLWLRKADRLSL